MDQDALLQQGAVVSTTDVRSEGEDANAMRAQTYPVPQHDASPRKPQLLPKLHFASQGTTKRPSRSHLSLPCS